MSVGTAVTWAVAAIKKNSQAALAGLHAPISFSIATSTSASNCSGGSSSSSGSTSGSYIAAQWKDGRLHQKTMTYTT